VRHRSPQHVDVPLVHPLDAGAHHRVKQKPEAVLDADEQQDPCIDSAATRDCNYTNDCYDIEPV